MSKSLKMGIITGVVVCVLMSFVGVYNGVQTSQQNVNAKWSQVENQMQRRGDLIPNLVNTVQGYSIHEKDTIQAIADARAKIGNAQTPVQKDEANTELNGALSRLMMVVENYPDLKADTQFNKLMDELSGTENRIAVSRRDYIVAVQSYNLKIVTFPNNVVANMFGFVPLEQFTATATAKTAPTVKF